MHTMKDRWLNALSYGSVLLLLWWVLTDGVTASWWIGMPAVLLTLMLCNGLISSTVFVWSKLPRFLLFFFLHSLLGGVDVARRVLRRNMSIAPELYEYTMRLPVGMPQVMMANSVGLLPGTLSVELENNVLTVHVLDKHTDFIAELEAVENNIARMFGKPLDDSKEVVMR
jgi:multicomponent Na+:H+ antiporter subunit E